MDERTHQRVDRDGTQDDHDPEQRRLLQPGRGDAADEADEEADRQVEIVDRDHEHLPQRDQRQRNRQAQHQVEAEIRDRARIEPADREQHQRQRDDGQSGTQQAWRQAEPHAEAASANEAAMMRASVTSLPSSSATMVPLRNT